MKYFNLVDHDGESMGILETNLSFEIVYLEWSVYHEIETDDYGIEEFIELLDVAYPSNHFTRFFIDDVIQPVSPEYIANKEKSKIDPNSLL